MKKTISAILISLLSVTFYSCKKNDKVYNLTFTASHNVTEENQFTEPYGYYSWSVEDKNYNKKFEKSDFVIRETVTGTTTAKKGDWVYIYISVNDVFDYGTVTCTSTDGSISLYAYTDNLYIDNSDSETVKMMNINRNGKDTTIKVKEVKFKI